MNKSKYYVYVIDLDKSILSKENAFRKKNPQYKVGKPCVYVGQSFLTPIERFKKHMQGHKAGRGYVTKYGRYLKKKRIPDGNPHLRREDAMIKEEEIANLLKKRGWAVWWN